MVKILWLLCLVLVVRVPEAKAQGADLTVQTKAFLQAYAHGEEATVLAAITVDSVVYGSDASEVFQGPEAVRQMLAADKKLWRGTAEIGEMTNVNVVKSGALQSIFFQAPFTVGGRPPVPVRFCMTWRRNHGRWILLQSSNAVVTEHQSAAELLGGR